MKFWQAALTAMFTATFVRQNSVKFDFWWGDELLGLLTVIAFYVSWRICQRWIGDAL